MTLPTIEELNLLHATICQAVGDPRRMQILYALHAQSRNVTAISECLDIPQPTVSRHLAVLKNSGLVTAERDGRSVIYRLVDERIIGVADTMRDILRDSLERQSDILE
ncbi:MAG: winged helix-turn-helix transcriptional regulator [Chloroflexi bacterium]|nr:winged helix-turn-helix transcriptional regulator [Chloroflexota bacterium]